MNTQMPIDYWKMFAGLMERRSVLLRQRDEAEVELAKTRPLIISVFGLLSEDQQKANQQAIDDMEAESSGLQDAIKLVFSTHQGEWFTVSMVREFLTEMGFDLRRYKANPSASIGTTLKRLAADFLKTTSSGSGTLYMRDPVYKLAEGARFGQRPPGADDLPVSDHSHPIHHPEPIARVGDVTGPTSAYDSGMRGTEKPKAKK
jgi:hypothetical protein